MLNPALDWSTKYAVACDLGLYFERLLVIPVAKMGAALDGMTGLISP